MTPSTSERRINSPVLIASRMASPEFGLLGSTKGDNPKGSILSLMFKLISTNPDGD